MRAAVGPDFPIVLRYSQWKQQDYSARLVENPAQLADFLEPLSDAGVDIFHCSTRRFWEPEFEDSNLNLAGWTKKLTGKPTITVGSIGVSNRNESDELPALIDCLPAGLAAIFKIVGTVSVTRPEPVQARPFSWD